MLDGVAQGERREQKLSEILMYSENVLITFGPDVSFAATVLVSALLLSDSNDKNNIRFYYLFLKLIIPKH